MGGLHWKTKFLRACGFLWVETIRSVTLTPMSQVARELKFGSVSSETRPSENPMNMKRTIKAWRKKGASSSSALESLKGFQSNSESVKEIQTSYSQKLIELESYISWFLTIEHKLGNNSRQKFERHQKDVLLSVRNLYESKSRQLLHQRPHGLQKNEAFATHYTSYKVEKNDRCRWIDTLSKMGETEKYCLGSQVGVYQRPLKQGWSDLMLELFVDVQEYELIPPATLSKFLNEENKGRIISSYFLNRYPFFDKTAVYLNFNLKLTLQENPYNKPLANFCRLLDEKAWEIIEFAYLKAWIEAHPKGSLKSSALLSLAEGFLKVASPEARPTSVPTETMSGYLTKLMSFLVSSPQVISHSSSILIIESKLGYDMLSFIMRYRKESISLKFLKNIRESFLFNCIRALEESIGLFSLFNYYIYFRGKEIYSNITEEELVKNTRILSRSILRVDRRPRLPERIQQDWFGDNYLTGSYKNLQRSPYRFTRVLEDFLNSHSHALQVPMVDMSDILHSPLRGVLSRKLELVDEIGKEIDLQARAFLSEVSHFLAFNPL